MFIPEQDFALDVYTDMFVTLSDAKALDSLSDPSALIKCDATRK